GARGRGCASAGARRPQAGPLGLAGGPRTPAGRPLAGTLHSDMAPPLVLHVIPPSHPCMTAAAVLRLKGLEHERVEFAPGEHVERMQAIYGEGNHTVPG